MEELKNCPNCGGILDDNGRCMYCKSKVYDLRDVKIDLDSNDILAFKIKKNGADIYFYAYPRDITMNVNRDYSDITDYSGNLMRFCSGVNAQLDMSFELVHKNDILYKIKMEKEYETMS